MPNYLKIAVENPAEELNSFPITQSIKLISSEILEDSLLESKITLLRNVREQGLINNADLYNYNVGYVKEKFSTVPIKVLLEENKIIVKPVEPLHTGSNYTLFLDKQLSQEYLSIDKTVSKGPSQLELLIDEHNTETLSSNTYRLKITSEPLITAKNNIVKLQLYVNNSQDKVFTVDAKSTKNTITFYGYTVKVLDTAYGKDEEFELKTKDAKVSLPENLVVNINTVLNKEIKPVDNANVSRPLSQKDIIDFYNKKDEEIITDTSKVLTQEEIDSDIRLEYVSYNKVLIHLTKLDVEQLDFKNMDVIEFPAYNRYDLECLGLYDCKQQFCIDYKVLDDKTVLLEFKEIKDEVL